MTRLISILIGLAILWPIDLQAQDPQVQQPKAENVFIKMHKRLKSNKAINGKALTNFLVRQSSVFHRKMLVFDAVKVDNVHQDCLMSLMYYRALIVSSTEPSFGWIGQGLRTPANLAGYTRKSALRTIELLGETHQEFWSCHSPQERGES